MRARHLVSLRPTASRRGGTCAARPPSLRCPRPGRPPCGEARDDLAEAADVVDDCGHAGAEHLQERPGDVDLRAIRKERDRRFGECPPELRVREVSQSPLGALAGGLLQAVERNTGISDDQEAGLVDCEHGVHGILDSLVGADEAEAERRPSVVLATHVRPKRGVRDHSQPLFGDAELDELGAAALGVHDDPLEPAEQRLPEIDLRGGPPGDDVVRGEDRRAARPEEPAVGLGRSNPLDVQHVRLQRREARHPERVLECLHGESHAGRSHPRRDGVEPLLRSIPVRGGHRAEPEPRRHELHVHTRRREGGGQRAVVRRRIGRGIRKHDAHSRER